MEQRTTAQRAGEWYMIDKDGDMMLRVHPGMSLGEKEGGDLSFDPARAQLTLDIIPDGSLVLASADDFELESGESKRHARASLDRSSRAEIHLPHHILRLYTEAADPVQPSSNLTVFTLRPAPKVTDAGIARFRKVLAEESREPAADDPRPLPARPSSQKGVGYPATPQEGRGRRADVSIGTFAPPHREQQGRKTRRRPLLTFVKGALFGLTAIGLAFSYPLLREFYLQHAPVGADTVRTPPADPPEAPIATSEPSSSSIETAPSVTRLPPVSAPLLDLPERSLPEPSPEAAVAQPPAERLPDPDAESESVDAPVVVQPSERAATPAPVPAVGSVEPESQAEAINRQVDPAVLSEAEEVAATDWANDTAQRLDLLDADLALRQGRLTAPPEASAYTLYSRVLARDPDSMQATRGLQAVRQELINRTLAQLAGNRLDQARESLQAAADVGASPQLIADLRAEIALRQRRIDARN